MKAKATLIIIFALSITVISCARGGGVGGGYVSNLKQVQQQHVGNYVVTVLNEMGQLKQGQNKMALEFRNTSDNKLESVGDVQVNSTMSMPGMSPMIGKT